MSISRRLYDILRAQVGHYTRRAGASLGSEGAAGDPAADGFPRDDFHKGRSEGEREALVKAYRLLELPYGSDAGAVRSAHKRLLRRYHPDRFARDADGQEDATRLSQELTAARDLLLNALESGSVRSG